MPLPSNSIQTAPQAQVEPHAQSQGANVASTSDISGVSRVSVAGASALAPVTLLPESPLLRVSVVIPVYNGGDRFKRCLNSLAQSHRQPDELIVVCDDPKDDSWKVALQYGADVIRLPRNSGAAAARNRGAEQASGDIIFFVDADVILHPATLGQVVDSFVSHPNVDALIGSYDDSPAEPNFLSQYRNLLHHYTHQTSSPEASTFWGACGAIRRSAFKAIDGFDPRCGNRVEDVELGYRLKAAGYQIRLCKHIQVKHLKRWQPIQMIRTDIFSRALPWTELLLRYGQPMNDLNLQVQNRLSVISAFASLGFLLAASFYPLAIAGMAIALVALWLLNLDIYRFFLRLRGKRFTIQAMAWHWLFYFYSGVAFAIGLARHHLPRARWNQLSRSRRRLVRKSSMQMRRLLSLR